MNNCFCRLFEDNTLWLIIIAILILGACSNGYGFGCSNNYSNNCPAGYNNGCGCN